MSTCSLSPHQLRARRVELQKGLASAVTGRRELPEGVAFRLPASRRAEALEFVEFERGCCASLDFTLAEEADTDSIWVEVRGADPDEVRRLFELPRRRRLFGTGISGLVAGALALIACEVPLVAAAIGLGAAGAYLDFAAVVLLVGGLAFVAVAVVLRRRAARS